MSVQNIAFAIADDLFDLSGLNHLLYTATIDSVRLASEAKNFTDLI